MPSRIMVVRQYSGRWTEAKYKKNERALMQSLQADGVTVTQVSATVPCFL